MVQYRIGDTVIIQKDRFAYYSHPCVTSLDNGEWLVAFKQARRFDPYRHPTEFPIYHTVLSRSADSGQTWSEASVAPDFDWYGTEVPGVAQLRDGTVILSHFRFRWYPLEVAKERRRSGERIFIHLTGRGWTEEFSEEDWDKSVFPWARGPHGLYIHRSANGGRTFEEPIKIDCTPYNDGYNRTAVVELSDGRICHALIEQHLPPQERNFFIVNSYDQGRTWEPPVLITRSNEKFFGVGEPHIVEVEPGELYGVIRHTQATGFLHQTRSFDGGKTWSEPKPTPLFGHPGHLLKLNDGRLLCTYGRREAPFGIRASVSEDAGHTWKEDQEIVIRDDFPDHDLGYPTTIEYAPGRLFVAYYGRASDGVTCVQGTYVDLM